MAPTRLEGNEIADLIRDWPGRLPDLALELRKLVLGAAPEVSEKIAFHSLCYYIEGRPYGVIGGNVCGIGRKGDSLYLGFIHGAMLPDPQGLLQGTGKAKRHIEIRSATDITARAYKQLIRAAAKFNPTAE